MATQNIYAMSDLHGQKEKFDKMLGRINFSNEDKLYIIGDVIDRGPDSIELLQEIMKMPNVIMMLGNHEQMMLASLSGDTLEANNWVRPQNGGALTLEAFSKADNQYEIIEYLMSAQKNIEIHLEVDGTRFTLVHAMPGEVYDVLESINSRYIEMPKDAAMVWDRALLTDMIAEKIHHVAKWRINEVRKPLAQLKKKLGTVIIGHTSVQNSGYKYIMPIPSCYTEKQLLIDCGAAFNGKLACLRLNDMTEFYI